MESESENESLEIKPPAEDAAMPSSVNNYDSENESLDIKPLLEASMGSPEDYDSEDEDIKPDIVNCDVLASLNSLPEKSRRQYETTYKLFMDWRQQQATESLSEDVLLSYFTELASKFKSSTLYAHYSMLKATLNINHGVDLTKYFKLKGFLKLQSLGYQPKKSKTFTSREINKFIKEAPDGEYLLIKVVLIMGAMGACRRHELHQMKITDLNDLGSAVLITIPNSKTKVVRRFTITGQFYDIFKKYAELRPTHAKDPSFFLNYQKGKCTIQKVGVNKLGAMGKQIAKYLELPSPELYTGHCFHRVHRSSAATLIDDGGDNPLNGYEGWQFTTVAKDYIDESMEGRFESDKRAQSIENGTGLPSTSKTEYFDNLDNVTFQLNCNDSPRIVFNNCSNITFNIVDNKK